MRMVVVAVGRLKAGPERDLASRYAERIAQTGRALGLAGPDVREIAESRARDAQTRKREEAAALLAAAPAGAIAVALDERGRDLASDDFAARLGAARDAARDAVFVIGGADGLAPEIRDRADLVLRFGAMTLPHQLVRVLLLEQIYRATTILSGHPYHRA